MELNENSTVEDVSEAARQWYDLAESEFIAMLGLDDTESVAYRGRAEGPSIVQENHSEQQKRGTRRRH